MLINNTPYFRQYNNSFKNKYVTNNNKYNEEINFVEKQKTQRKGFLYGSLVAIATVIAGVLNKNLLEKCLNH